MNFGGTQFSPSLAKTDLQIIPPPPSLFLFYSSHFRKWPQTEKLFLDPYLLHSPLLVLPPQSILFQPLPTSTFVPPHCPFSTQHIIEPIKTSSRLAHSSHRTLQHLRTSLLPRVHRVLPISTPCTPPHHLCHHPWVSSHASAKPRTFCTRCTCFVSLVCLFVT